MMIRDRVLKLLTATAALAACTQGPLKADGQSVREPLSIATWNLEHLAEANGSGCRPRSDDDYAALSSYAASLDADVIAFQEVENAAAAQRVFDPAVYSIVIEQRTGTPNSKPPCNGAPQLHLNRQATGFAIRKELKIERHPDFTALQDGDPNLRSGVDVTVTPPDGTPIRLLSVHLKSGCARGDKGASCETLRRQADVLEGWIEARAKGAERFTILGDFNRRLALPSDGVWAVLDGPPGPTDLTLAAGETRPHCDARYTSFIDHIVLDPRAARPNFKFNEITYGAGEHLSDHCAVSVTLDR
jgi:endonuclease/exonuclease/phosphatase family metal-dependent hydrolase